MTTAVANRFADYVENGVTKGWAVPFRFIAASDIRAQRKAANGTITPLTNGVHFSVTGGATDAGGTLTTTTAAAAGVELNIWCETARGQTADYDTGDTFPAETHELRLDTLDLIAQEQDAALARKVGVPAGEPGIVLAPRAQRASKYPHFDASGNLEYLIGSSDDQTALAQAVIDAEAAETAAAVSASAANTSKNAAAASATAAAGSASAAATSASSAAAAAAAAVAAPTMTGGTIASGTSVLDSGTIGAGSVGYRGIPVSANTTGTLALTDAGKQLIVTANQTIPANSSVAFPVGTVIEIFNNSASTITVAITTDTMRFGALTGTRTIAAYGSCFLSKKTSTMWKASGDLT